MSLSTSLPYAWVKTLPTSLLERHTIPLVSSLQPFPWQKLTESLIQRLELSKLSLSPSNWQWRDTAHTLEGISGTPYLLGIGLQGYEGHVLVAMDHHQLSWLMASLLRPNTAPDLATIDPSYQTGFSQFLTLEILDVLATLPWEKGLQYFLIPHAELQNEPYLTLDLTGELDNQPFTLRLLLDTALHTSWQERHQPSFDPSLNPVLAQRLSLPVSLYAGYTTFSLAEWKRVQPGDFLLLDACGLDPSLQHGDLSLVVHHLPFFKAQLTDGAVLLTDQATSDEVVTFMVKNQDDDDFDFEDDDDFDFEDEDFNFEEIADEESSEESPQRPTQTGSQENEEETEAEHSSVAKSAPVAPAPSESAAKLTKKTAPKAGSTKDIPLTVAIEVARLEMTVEKLMQLQPGNLLELNIRPEDGVDLIFNGRRIGRGELLLLGESLGVRVTEI